jgi:16S rRNA processing protein RimM
VRGDVRVKVLTGFPERLKQHSYVYLAAAASPTEVHRYTIEHVRFHRDVLLLRLHECQDRDTAGALRGMLVQIPVEDAVPLDTDEYYAFQIIGLAVTTDTGLDLGRITDVLETGANDVYVVRGPYGELLLPAIREVILELNLEKGRATVHLIPGLAENVP